MIPEDPEMYARTFRQMLDLWVTPEIKRRQERGECPKPLNLRTAQVLFFADGRPHNVRLNDEVNVTAMVKLKPGVSKKKGEDVYAHDIEKIERFKLSDDVDPDCGHITTVLVGNHWHLFFDFRYNKAWAAEHIEAAKQFLGSAEYARSKNQWRACLDNAFSAAELAARAILLSMPDQRKKPPSSHKATHNRFNRFAQHGNIDAEHRDVFNKLAQARENARYPRRELIFEESTADRYLGAVRGLIEKAEQWYAMP